VNTDEHPPICIDTKYASFYDDAFSLSPATGELLVHVVDVVNLLRRQEPLRAVCKDRISSQFLPSGPLHMLPPLVRFLCEYYYMFAPQIPSLLLLLPLPHYHFYYQYQPSLTIISYFATLNIA